VKAPAATSSLCLRLLSGILEYSRRGRGGKSFLFSLFFLAGTEKGGESTEHSLGQGGGKIKGPIIPLIREGG